MVRAAGIGGVRTLAVSGAVRLRALALLLGLLLLAGCAPTTYVFRYGNETLTQDQLPRWPLPPEIPRFLYAGALVGEANYEAEQPVDRSQVEAAFAWLVGLVLQNPDPRRLVRPQGVLVDATDRILVTDLGAAAVFVFDEQAGKLVAWEWADLARRFDTPVGITAGAGDEVLVTDAELGEVFRFDRDGQPLGSFGQGLLQRPTGIARDPATGLVFVADTGAHDIKVFDGAGRLVEAFGSHGERVGEFNGPTHLAFAHGRLYVADTLNARIQVLDASTGGPERTFGERGILVGNLVRPKGIAVDDEGHIYVVESLHDHLLVYDAQGRFLLPIGGEGGGPGQFYLPAGVTVDRHNRVFVADMFNRRIAVFQFLGGA